MKVSSESRTSATRPAPVEPKPVEPKPVEPKLKTEAPRAPLAPGFSDTSSFDPTSAATPPASSLLTEDAFDASTNCLDRAADWVGIATPALRARSELVFLSDTRPGVEGSTGHVVVRQGDRVLDPVTGKSFDSLTDYLSTNPQYQPAGTVSATVAARIFDTPPGSPARAAAIADAKLSPGLATLLVADAAPAAPAGYSQADADRDAMALHEAVTGGLTGWGTDEDGVWSTLAGRTPAELELISESYGLHYGKSLRHDVLAEVEGSDAARAAALLDGDGARAAAALIAGELEDTFVDEGLILSTLERASPAERQAIAAAFAASDAAAAGRPATDVLLERLSDSFDAGELSRARALLSAGDGPATDPNEAAALAGKLDAAMAGAGTDEAALREVLADRAPAERAQIAAAYEARFGVPLRDRLSQELSGGERDELLGYLDSSGDAATDAARLYEAMSGAGTDEAKLHEVLEGKTPAERSAIAASYEATYGEPLRDRVASELGGAERDVVLRLLEPSTPEAASADAAAERLAAAVEGVGTDEAAIRAELAGRSKPELDQIAAAYERKYGEPLRDRLVSELGGRDQLALVTQAFDLGAVDPTAPGAVTEEVRRLREQLDLERGFGLSLTSFVQDLTKGESDEARLETQLIAAEIAPEPEQAAQRTRFATGDLAALQSAKDSAAEGTAQGAAIVASAVATIATAGAGAPLLAVVGAGALAGGTAGGGAYALIEGRAADAADTVKQTVIGALTGATAALPVKGGSALEALGLGARAGAVAGAADGALRAGLDENGTSLEQVGLGLLTGAATGAVLGGLLGGAWRGVSSAARAMRGAPPELASGLTLAETGAVFPWGGPLPQATRSLFEVPGFADFARTSPAAAKVLSDAGALWSDIASELRDHAARTPAGPELEAAWAALATRYEAQLPRITPHPTNPKYLVVERGPYSGPSTPELALHPTAALDHNGAFARTSWDGSQWVTTAAPSPTMFDPAQLIVGGQPLKSLDGVMVFSGHGAPIGFSGISTKNAAVMVADQIRAAAAAGRRIETVVLDACHQRDTRWFRGGSNSQAFRDFVNAELAMTGDAPVTVLAAERGGPIWGKMQRSWFPTGLEGGRLQYTFETARYVDAGLDSRFYVGPGVVALGAATAAIAAGEVAVLRYTYGEER